MKPCLPNIFFYIRQYTEKWHCISCLTKLANFCVQSGRSWLSGSPQVLTSWSCRVRVSCCQTVPEYVYPQDCGPDGKEHKLWGELQTAKGYSLYQQVLSPTYVLFSKWGSLTCFEVPIPEFPEGLNLLSVSVSAYLEEKLTHKQPVCKSKGLTKQRNEEAL